MLYMPVVEKSPSARLPDDELFRLKPVKAENHWSWSVRRFWKKLQNFKADTRF